MFIIPILPFIILLISIAVIPLINEKWWNKNYSILSFILAGIIIIYYLFFKNDSEIILHTAEEYLSFISLLFSLYVISGGIYIQIKGKSTPFKNLLLLAFGSVIANLFGTTGAAMLLIRPYLISNEYRLKSYHIIFFIFTVCNVGGSLTPIGDPPLFLGYLKGIPFFWVVEHMFIYWLLATAYLLIVFYFIDKYYYSKVRGNIKDEVEQKGEEFKYKGIFNLIPLAIIIASVFITKPVFLREIIMITTAFLSYKYTSKEIHQKNHFNFKPIKEVAILFIGIFITMIPALQFISENSKSLGLNTVSDFYWGSGLFTSFLDNAPTYLNFIAASMANFGLSSNNTEDVLKFINSQNHFIVAISVACVFFGAMTYIGNGPNFMVKSISEHRVRHIKIPGFFKYLYYSLLILLPFYFFLWIIFFRN